MRATSARCAVAVLTMLAVAPTSAAGHGTSPIPATKGGERRLRAVETAILGPEHAAEHARERSLQRRELAAWRSLSPAQRARRKSRAHARATLAAAADRAATRAAGPAAEVGAWTTAPFPILNYAIHSALLPTGKVLLWGYPQKNADGTRPNFGMASVWDPAQGTGPGSMESVPPPQIDVDGDGDTEAAPIYCGAESLLPSGAVLVAGGVLVWAANDPADAYTGRTGPKTLFTFDPFSETWVQQPNMERGRYYPSQAELADGRTAIVAGADEQAPGNFFNREFELFTPSASPSGVGSLEHVPSADRDAFMYPHLVTMPDGSLFMADPAHAPSSLLDTQTFTWSDGATPSRGRTGGNAVLRPGGPDGSSTVTQIGGYDLSDGIASSTTETIDPLAPGASWQADAPLNIARSFQNTVLLPDGSMVAVGGSAGNYGPDGPYVVYPDQSNRQVELYDPATGGWALGPAQTEDRSYHSVALLLPDGRVLSAGDDDHPTGAGGAPSTSDTAEIYSPPYLFRGPRPAIAAAPDSVAWGDEFGIASTDPGASRAVLVAPGAPTHGLDMQQRQVELQVTRDLDGQGLDVKAPPTGGVAPPGYYMLFILNGDGVPSIAHWIKLDPAAPDRPVLGPAGSAVAGASNPRPAKAKRCKKKHGHAKRKCKRKKRGRR